MLLSQAEADNFLVNVLHFKNWDELFQRDRVEFLRAFVPHYLHHTYFQNIVMTACPPDKRRCYNDKDAATIGLKGAGGPCMIENSFLVILLQAIGLNAYAVTGYVHGPGLKEDNHIICIVEFSPEEKYLLDLGIALPFKEPVLMSSLPHENTAGGLSYRYKLAEEGSELYYRVQLDGSLYGGVYPDKEYEFIRYDFKMTPVPINFFVKPLTGLFTDEDTSPFLHYPILFRYFEEDNSEKLLDEVNVAGNRKWILIRGVSVVIGTDEGKRVTHYSNYDELKPLIFKYFPKIQREDVETAVGHFNKSVPKCGYFKAK